MTSRTEATDLFYSHMEGLAQRIGGFKHLTDPTLARHCPKAGLYFFFERGELRPNGRPRVVRIGTHALTPSSKTTLWSRLRHHMGRTGGSNPGGGNHRGSIFRRHVGSALLNQRGDTDLLGSWMAPDPVPDYVHSERALEVEVSRVIREMPFLWLGVPTRRDGSSDRGLLERNLISLLSTLAAPRRRPAQRGSADMPLHARYASPPSGTSTTSTMPTSSAHWPCCNPTCVQQRRQMALLRPQAVQVLLGSTKFHST